MSSQACRREARGRSRRRRSRSRQARRAGPAPGPSDGLRQFSGLVARSPCADPAEGLDSVADGWFWFLCHEIVIGAAKSCFWRAMRFRAGARVLTPPTGAWRRGARAPCGACDISGVAPADSPDRGGEDRRGPRTRVCGPHGSCRGCSIGSLHNSHIGSSERPASTASRRFCWTNHSRSSFHAWS